MAKYKVEVPCLLTFVVEAVSEEHAEQLAMEMYEDDEEPDSIGATGDATVTRHD